MHDDAGRIVVQHDVELVALRQIQAEVVLAVTVIAVVDSGTPAEAALEVDHRQGRQGIGLSAAVVVLDLVVGEIADHDFRAGGAGQAVAVADAHGGCEKLVLAAGRVDMVDGRGLRLGIVFPITLEIPAVEHHALVVSAGAGVQRHRQRRGTRQRIDRQRGGRPAAVVSPERVVRLARYGRHVDGVRRIGFEVRARIAADPACSLSHRQVGGRLIADHQRQFRRFPVVEDPEGEEAAGLQSALFSQRVDVNLRTVVGAARADVAAETAEAERGQPLPVRLILVGLDLVVLIAADAPQGAGGTAAHGGHHVDLAQGAAQIVPARQRECVGVAAGPVEPPPGAMAEIGHAHPEIGRAAAARHRQGPHRPLEVNLGGTGVARGVEREDAVGQLAVAVRRVEVRRELHSAGAGVGAGRGPGQLCTELVAAEHQHHLRGQLAPGAELQRRGQDGWYELLIRPGLGGRNLARHRQTTGAAGEQHGEDRGDEYAQPRPQRAARRHFLPPTWNCGAL